MSFLFSQPAPGILPANSVDFSEVETIASNTLLGNNTGSDSVILELSKTQATAMLDVMGVASAGSGGLKGLVPASSAGDQTKFLRADATWNTIDLSGLQPLDSDLTAIAGLTPADDDIIQRKSGSWTNRTPAQFKTDLSLTKSDVGLSNVDNTSDANKPISTATQLALNAKVDSVSGSSPISSSGGTTPTISISDFGGATSLLPGSRGSVPAPAAGDQAKFLRGDASWATVDPLPSQTGNQNKVLVTSGSAASWQYAGLGDGNFGTNDVIVGRDKPAGFTGTGTVIVGSGAGTNAATNSVLIGYLADGYTESISIGKSSFTGNYGLAIGIGSFAGNYGIGIGHTANGSGSGIAIGQNASANSNCLAIGISASSTTGVAIGGSSSCSGTDSTAVGVGSTASGQFTTAIGAYAATAAVRSVAIGYGAGYGSTNTASYSTFVGMWAGKSGVSGAGNTLIGAESGKAITSGASNTILGSQTAAALTTGSGNLLLGYTAGDAITTGSNNTILGDIAGTTTLADTIILAAGTNERIRVDSSGNVGIGTSSPGAKLAIKQGTGIFIELESTASTGSQYINAKNSTGTAWRIGYLAGNDDFSIDNLKNSPLLFNTNNSEKMRVEAGGNVGIGTTSPGEKLEVSGNVKVSSGDLSIATAGKGLAIKSGANAKIGTATFTAQNTVTVGTTALTANSLIFVTGQDGNDQFCVGNKNVGAGTFDIVHTSGNTTAVVAWMIVEAI